MLNELTGSRVLIIGGAGRMGSATALRAAEAGATVTVAGPNRAALEAVVGSIDANTIACDAEDPRAVWDLLTAAQADHVAMMVSSRIAESVADIPGTRLANAQSAYGRLWASYNVLHAAREGIASNGSLTLLSGSSGRRPLAGVGVWGALHGAIEALARSAALELSPIRVNVVSPGGIGMRKDRQLADHAGRPTDVAAMIVALMSNPAVTGAVVDVDGGERLGSFSG
jgi:NAD(P)-dependent dehydrogenase (short-subunit alcohol dehydrogenase family)